MEGTSILLSMKRELPGYCGAFDVSLGAHVVSLGAQVFWKLSSFFACARLNNPWGRQSETNGGNSSQFRITTELQHLMCPINRWRQCHVPFHADWARADRGSQGTVSHRLPSGAGQAHEGACTLQINVSISLKQTIKTQPQTQRRLEP